ncbi:MAG: hypothetical protein WCO00_07250 [Rhodospirillaceae bacterium]
MAAEPVAATAPALTARATFDEDIECCRAAGMEDFLAKPIDPAQFYAALSRWLRAPATQTGSDAPTTHESHWPRLTSAILATPAEDASAGQGKGLDWPTVRQVLDSLDPALAECSVLANPIIESHGPLLKLALGALGLELEQRVADFRYPEAQETMRRVRQQDLTPGLNTAT